MIMSTITHLNIHTTLICTLTGIITVAAVKPNYCQPFNMSCWPTTSEINALSQTLNGDLLQPSDGINYATYVNMTRDTLYISYPAFIAVCLSAQDIQVSIKFAVKHNLQISICSTGHSYSGRNTANNSLQINLSKMQKFTSWVFLFAMIALAIVSSKAMLHTHEQDQNALPAPLLGDGRADQRTHLWA